jgi:hypothetical protein
MNTYAEVVIYVLQSFTKLVKFCTAKIDTPLWPNGPTGQQYLDGLTRRDKDGKPRGSWVEQVKALADIPNLIIDAEYAFEFTPEAAKEGCRYFSLGLTTDIDAFVNVMRVADAKLKGYEILVRDGDHGKELISHIPEAGWERVHFITVIVEDGMMSTWFPGPVFHPTPQEFPVDQAEWDGEWPVKRL